jgi:hypothetical protein
MRGQASGFGARISSMVGLFIVTAVQLHRPDKFLDERNFPGG